MGVYEITTEGGVYEIETEDPPTFKSEAGAVGSEFVRGATDLVDLGANILTLGGFNKASPITMIQEATGGSIGDAWKKGLGSLGLYTDEKPKTPAGKVLGEVAYSLPSAAIPAGSATLAGRAGLAALGGLGSGVTGLVTDNPYAKAAGGIAATLLLAGASKVGQLVGKAAEQSADDLERSALGIMRSEVKAARKFAPKSSDEQALTTALKNVRERGLLTGSKHPEALLARNQAMIEAGSGQIDDLIKNADEARIVAKEAAVPTFDNARRFIEEAPPGTKDSLLKQFQRAVSDIEEGWDGSIKYLQEQKKALGKKAYKVADTDSADLDKAITTDLRQAVEGYLSKFSDQEASDLLQGINRDIGANLTMRPILQRAVDQLGTGNEGLPLVIRRAAVSPVGGSALGLIGSLLTANPIPALAGGGLALAASRPGRFALANAMRSLGGVLPKTGPSLGAAAQSAALQSAIRSMGAEPSVSPEAITMEVPKIPEIPVIEEAQADDDIAPLVEAVIQQESAGDPNAVSEVGAQGLMQIMPETAKDIAKELGVEDYDLKDPETNRVFGTHYLKKLIGQFNGDIALALTAYHSGPGRVEKLLKKTKGNSLEDIIDHLGPVGRKYASGVLSKLERTIA